MFESVSWGNPWSAENVTSVKRKSDNAVIKTIVVRFRYDANDTLWQIVLGKLEHSFSFQWLDPFEAQWNNECL